MFNLDEEVEKLKAMGPDKPVPLEHMALITATALDKAATQKAFEIYHDREFKKLSKVESLPQLEQDRIFNELILANLVLVMLTLVAPDLRVPEEMKEYFLLVKDTIPKAHDNELKGLGIEREFRKDWKKLIQMRYEEYSQDKHKAREAAMILEAKGKDSLTIDDISGIQLTLPVPTVAIGCHFHICRGKTRGKNELFRKIVRSLGRFYVEIRVPIEGGRINFWTRSLVKGRRFWDRVRKLVSGSWGLPA